MTIVKAEGERLGMHIKGGLKGQRGNPLDVNDEGVFISKINSSGAVRRDGRLKVGMRILEVNGQSLLGATHQEAVESLRLSANRLNMVVCKGFEKSDLIHGMISGGSRLGSRASETGSELSQSVSSLDREDFDSSTVIQNSHAESLLNKSDDVFVEKESDAASTSEEIARLANEVALFSQTENALVSVKEKSTPEKVKGFINCSLAHKLTHLLVFTGSRHCSSRRVVGIGRHRPTEITRRPSRVAPEDNNDRNVEAHAEHNGTTATTTAAGDASSSDAITTISGMSFMNFTCSFLFFTHLCVIILLFKTNRCLGSFQL